MKTIADINIVLPILVQAHAHHPTAWAWWQTRRNASVALCLPVRLGVLRLLTNPHAMAGNPVSNKDALDAMDLLTSDPRVLSLDSFDGMVHRRIFRQMVESRPPNPNLWTDAWLAALAATEGIALTSFDEGFARFNLGSFFEHLTAAP